MGELSEKECIMTGMMVPEKKSNGMRGEFLAFRRLGFCELSLVPVNSFWPTGLIIISSLSLFFAFVNCMGHYRFAAAAKSESGVESDISDQVESMNLNGLQRVTQAHQQLLEQTRRRLRDRISSRMGELLLLGHTMLNEYCELCEGIVMEDRQGVRSCITCDMVNRELSRRQGDRSAAFNNDDMNDLNGAVHEHSNMSRGSGASQSSAQFLSTDCPLSLVEGEGYCTRSIRSDRLPVEAGISPHVNLLESRSVNTAIKAVEDKLKWCAERLRSCENVEEVMKLYQTIDCGIRILKNSTGV